MNRTELRHRMLRAVADAEPGTYHFVRSMGTNPPRWRSAVRPLQPGQVRALRELDHNNFLSREASVSPSWFSRMPLSVSKSGLRLLAEWDEKFGAVDRG